MGQLSGGERNRVHLAKVLKSGSNVLLLDEPTNDLDVETIELLEERLLDYNGTLLLVSHDRDFLDNVVTATLALDGQGGITEYAGGCADWLERMNSPKRTSKIRAQEPAPVPVEEPPKRKLLNKEREALKELPKKIEQMEEERDRITSSMQSPDYYRNPENDPAGDQARLEKLETKIAQDFERWEELEALA